MSLSEKAFIANPRTPEEIYAARVPKQVEQLLFEVRKIIVGQDRLLERVLVALLSGGHILVEGVPGLAKTATVRAFANAIGGKFGRIQFTPDLVPSDLVGTRVFNPRKADFSTELGPIFCNLLLADEVNRAPAKVQSALLEVMQERQVTIGKETFKVDEPFLVLATQNPIEADGTYPLPEAQIDRFMLKVIVGYPSSHEEMGIVQRMIGEPIQVQQVLAPEELLELQRQVRKVYVDPAVVAYATTLVSATRNLKASGVAELESAVDYGGSPRATIHLVSAGRALAFIRGRSYVLGQDLAAVAPEVLRHRIVLSYEGIADGVSPDTIERRTGLGYRPDAEARGGHRHGVRRVPLIARHGSRVGAIVFDANVRRILPPVAGRRGRLHLVGSLDADLSSAPTGAATALAAALWQAVKIIRRPGLLIVISNFLAAGGWQRPMAVLGHRHELVAARVVDPTEMAVPDIGVVTFEDPETGRQLHVDTSDRRLRERFQLAAVEQSLHISTDLKRAHAVQFEITTAQPFLPQLTEYLRRRSAEVSRRGGAHPA